mmetsp:Transcript_138550/g.386477  ORF Transcript_138550/g.386477 Transcript_138550/m.386477 type:complete len:187 (-) Transcript_138550:184-744(-)
MNQNASQGEGSEQSSKSEVVKFWLVGHDGQSLSSRGSSKSDSLASSEWTEDAPLEEEEPEPTEPVTEFVRKMHEETGTRIIDLQALDAQGLLQQVPRDAGGKLASVGSIGHKGGECSPCLFMSRKCCSKGILCQFCHLPHETKKKQQAKVAPIRQLEHDQTGKNSVTSEAHINGSKKGNRSNIISL